MGKYVSCRTVALAKGEATCRVVAIAKTEANSILKAGTQQIIVSTKLSWRHLAICLITLYQKHISPRKGYCCAHRYRTGGMSCSQYAQSVISRHKFRRAISLFIARLKLCKRSAKIIRRNTQNTSGQNTDPDTAKKSRKSSSTLAACDGGALGCDAAAQGGICCVDIASCGGADFCSGPDCCEGPAGCLDIF